MAMILSACANVTDEHIGFQTSNIPTTVVVGPILETTIEGSWINKSKESFRCTSNFNHSDSIKDLPNSKIDYFKIVMKN